MHQGNHSILMQHALKTGGNRLQLVCLSVPSNVDFISKIKGHLILIKIRNLSTDIAILIWALDDNLNTDILVEEPGPDFGFGL